MILRPATVADRAAVVALALHFHASSPYAQLLAVDAARVGAVFDVALATGVVVVAEPEYSDDDDLAGFFALVVVPHELSGERAGIEVGWWVQPELRNGTLGPRLLRWAEEWAQAHGVAFVKVAEPGVGTSVGRFYARVGYQPVETAWMKRLAAAQAVA